MGMGYQTKKLSPCYICLYVDGHVRLTLIIVLYMEHYGGVKLFGAQFFRYLEVHYGGIFSCCFLITNWRFLIVDSMSVLLGVTIYPWVDILDWLDLKTSLNIHLIIFYCFYFMNLNWEPYPLIFL
jgi:hypothetical protein